MAKDPAFLFYSKDWLEGTAEMTPDEKGVYIDLLAHQHQKGSLPADTKRLAKMVGISEQEFLTVWTLLKNKFNQTDDRMVNRKLSEVTTDRLSKSHTNRITGKFATLIRSVKHLPKKDVETLKKEFKLTDFDHLPTELATERLTEWFYKRLQCIGDANANEDGIGNTNTDATAKKNDSTENLFSGLPPNQDQSIIGQMWGIWKITFPKYTADKDSDFEGLGKIFAFMCRQNGTKSHDPTDSDFQIKFLNTFQILADEVAKESFWINKPLKSIANNIQEFYNKIKNPVNGTAKQQQAGRSTKIDDDKLKQKLAAKLDSWKQNSG